MLRLNPLGNFPFLGHLRRVVAGWPLLDVIGVVDLAPQNTATLQTNGFSTIAEVFLRVTPPVW